MFFFFFFQAEDGIRDDLVTGVQTCALPIYRFRSVTQGGRGSGMVTSAPGAGEEPEPVIQVAIVSGLSGAGRSTAAKCLEDLGWFVVDNLPPELISTMVDLGSRTSGDVTRIAIVLDVRSRAFTEDLAAVIKDLDAKGYRPRVLFLEAG